MTPVPFVFLFYELMATDADNTTTNPRYDLQAEKIGRFLSMFQEENATEYKYIQLIVCIFPRKLSYIYSAKCTKKKAE